MSDIADDCGGHSTPSPGGSIAGDVSDGVVEAVADEAPSFSPRGLSLFLIQGGSTLWDNRHFNKLLEPQEVADGCIFGAALVEWSLQPLAIGDGESPDVSHMRELALLKSRSDASCFGFLEFRVLQAVKLLQCPQQDAVDVRALLAIAAHASPAGEPHQLRYFFQQWRDDYDIDQADYRVAPLPSTLAMAVVSGTWDCMHCVALPRKISNGCQSRMLGITGGFRSRAFLRFCDEQGCVYYSAW